MEKQDFLDTVENVGSGILGSYIIAAAAKGAVDSFKQKEYVKGAIKCGLGSIGLKLAAEAIYNISGNIIKHKK